MALEERRRRNEDRLDLRRQVRRVIPESIFRGKEAQQRLSFVSLVNLSGTQLTSLPSDRFFFWMIRLRYLDLSRNTLSDLPEEMKELQQLEVLSLHNNKFTRLPLVVCELRTLKSLLLFNNLLTTLPLELGRLSQLRTLALQGNRLQMLPNGLFRSLSSLTSVSLELNGTLSLPNDLFFARALEVSFFLSVSLSSVNNSHDGYGLTLSFSPALFLARRWSSRTIWSRSCRPSIWRNSRRI